jgi:hypothetical protein
MDRRLLPIIASCGLALASVLLWLQAALALDNVWMVLSLLAAARLGAHPHDDSVLLVTGVWAAMAHTAWGRLRISPEQYAECPLIMADRLDRVVAEFSAIVAAPLSSALPSTS